MLSICVFSFHLSFTSNILLQCITKHKLTQPLSIFSLAVSIHPISHSVRPNQQQQPSVTRSWLIPINSMRRKNPRIQQAKRSKRPNLIDRRTPIHPSPPSNSNPKFQTSPDNRPMTNANTPTQSNHHPRPLQNVYVSTKTFVSIHPLLLRQISNSHRFPKDSTTRTSIEPSLIHPRV